MTVQALIMSLISGIDDARTRIEIARTLHFLHEVYKTGKAPENEIRKSLFEVALTVIKYKNPDMTDEEAKEKANEWADKLMREFKMESMFTLTLGKMSLPPI